MVCRAITTKKIQGKERERVKMKKPIVFYLTEQKISEDAGSIKLLYVENLDYWKAYGCLSPLPVSIPLDMQYHLHIGTQLTNNVFQIDDQSITEQDFIDVGFIKDEAFENMFKNYQAAEK